MNRDSVKVLSLIKEGQRILGEEAKEKQARVDMKKFKEERQWKALYNAAKCGLPVEIAGYLLRPAVDQYVPATCANYYNWQLKIASMLPIEVRFGDDGQPCGYIVPLAEPSFDGFSKQIARTFSGDKAVEKALTFAVEQTIALRQIEAERERLAKEYEEREALASKEPKYEPVDGSEPVPDLVLISGVHRIVQEELKKLGVIA